MGTVPSTKSAWAPKTPGFFPSWAPYPVLNTAGHLDPAPPSIFCPSPWDTGHWVHGKYGKYQPDDSKVTRRLLRKKSKPSFVHDWIKILFAWLLEKPKTVFLLQTLLFVAFIATVLKKKTYQLGEHDSGSAESWRMSNNFCSPAPNMMPP